MNKNKKARVWKEYGILTAGTVVMIITDYMFKFPNHFTFGGVTGIAVLLSGIFGGTANTYASLMNIALLVLGLLVLGKSSGIKTIYVTVCYSVGLEAVQYLFPFKGPLTDQPVLELVFAFMLIAVCSAVFFYMDASSGGTDIIALIIKKYVDIPIGRALLVTDFFVVMLSFFVYGRTVGMFSLAGFLAKAFFVDTVIESLNLCKYFTIVSTNSGPICDFIHEKLNHSATVYRAEGSYTHQEKMVILTVVSRSQGVELRNFVREADPQAFMMITNSSEIIGKGFQGAE